MSNTSHLLSTSAYPTQAEIRQTAGRELLASKSVRKRYDDVTNRTIDRWILSETMGFPKPMMINGRRYWYLDELIAWERTRATKRGVAA